MHPAFFRFKEMEFGSAAAQKNFESTRRKITKYHNVRHQVTFPFNPQPF
jgi:hypothetical protein